TRHPLTLSTQVPLLHFEQFYIKDERCIRGNCARRAPLAIAKAWRNDEPALSTDTHALHPFIPALDHLAAAQRKLERVTSITRAIELLPISEPPGVVYRHQLACQRLVASADLNVD